jgi:hypothetical protein
VLACVIEREAHGGNTAVHHVARCNDVGACLGERHGGLRQQRDTGIVLNCEVLTIASNDTAMAMRGVLAQANVSNGHKRLRRLCCLDRAQTALHDTIAGISAGTKLVLHVRNAEQQQTADTQFSALGYLFHCFVDRKIEDAGHGADLAANALALAQEQWIDQRAGLQVRLAHERAHDRRGAQAAQACSGEFHNRILGPQTTRQAVSYVHDAAD